jgi:hypothetical protein
MVPPYQSSKSKAPSGAGKQQPRPAHHRDDDGHDVSGPNNEILAHSACAAHPPMARNKAARAVSSHEAESEDRRQKFNELDHVNLSSFAEFSILRQYDKSATIGLSRLYALRWNKRHSIGPLRRLLFGLLHRFTKEQQFPKTLA